MPPTSVILTSHNTARFIGDAIESVLAQTAPVSEIIVVDDSTDDSPAIIQRYESRSATSGGGRVKLLRVPPCNICKARNHGLDAATGDTIAFLDGDDVWLPEKLEWQIKVLDQNPDTAGVWCRYFDFEHHLEDLGRRQLKRTKDDPSVYDVILKSDIPASTQIIRTSMVKDLRFDERSGHGEDVIFAGDVRLRGRWRLIDAALVGKRIHGEQVTKSAWHRLYSSQTRARWCREHADQIGKDLAWSIENDICHALVWHLEGLYWRRELTDLPAMRKAARDFCPRQLKKSPLGKARIYPRWVYKIRDRFSSHPSPKASAESNP